MARSLTERADAIRARAAIVESVPGSGLHDTDRDWRGNPIAPQRKGLPKTSEHVVAFIGEYTVRFAGPDADRVIGALGDWHDRNSALSFDQWSGTDRALMRLIPKQEIVIPNGERLLVLHRTDWNDFLHAIQKSGLGVSCDQIDDTRAGEM